MPVALYGYLTLTAKVTANKHDHFTESEHVLKYVTLSSSLRLIIFKVYQVLEILASFKVTLKYPLP